VAAACAFVPQYSTADEAGQRRKHGSRWTSWLGGLSTLQSWCTRATVLSAKQLWQSADQVDRYGGQGAWRLSSTRGKPQERASSSTGNRSSLPP
jgi:hypothetical protein